MLTGDNTTTAKAVASKLSIDEVVADVLPQDKANVVKKLQGEGKFVAMAGDGVNDAPALAQAHVGIAMGTGTDIAMESPSVTLVKGDLRGIVRARRLGFATMRNIKQNLFFALVYNSIGVPLAAGVLIRWPAKHPYAGQVGFISARWLHFRRPKKSNGDGGVPTTSVAVGPRQWCSIIEPPPRGLYGAGRKPTNAKQVKPTDPLD